MSHVDEGALHAYLDGALDEYPAAEAVRIRAHLDACAECAGRLEEERSVRAEAHGILALAAPEVEAPSFEELRAYVQRTRPAGGGAPTRAVRMRWAASVVLALGTGWLLRGGIPGPAADAVLEAPEAARPPETESGTIGPADLASGDVQASTAGREAGFTEAAQAPAPVERQEPASTADLMAEEERVGAEVASTNAVAAGGARADGVTPRAAEPDPARRTLDEQVVGMTADAADVLTDAAGGGATAAEAVVASPSEPSLPAAAPKVEAGDRAALVPPVTALSASAADADSGAASADRETLAETRARSASRDQLAVSALEQGPATGLPAPPEDDLEAGSAPAVRMTVPGYAIVSITNLGQGTTYYGVQAVQRLETGSTFEIYHLEPDVERSVVPAPTDGVGEVAARTDEGWIVLQGPLPVAELQALLQGLFPEGAGQEG